MFTTPEAVTFLQDRWGVQGVEERFSDAGRRKDLLDEIVRLVQVHVPFQNITFMATPPEHRSRPTMEVIREECRAGVGGLCYYINVFAWGLLKGVGFKARLCPATCCATVTSPNNHIIVLVYDLEKDGDLHLVECGVGYPTFRAVSLRFQEESPVCVDSFLEYKHIRHQGRYLRMHGSGDTMKHYNPTMEGLDFIVGKWRRFYHFSLEPSDDLSDFDATFDRLFTVPQVTPFDRSPRALAFPDQGAVILVNNRLMLDIEGQLQTTVLEGDEAIVDAYRRNFPVLEEHTVRSALLQWHSAAQQ